MQLVALVLVLMFFFISKEVFVLTKIAVVRILKTSLTSEDEIKDFNPGTHIGLVIGLIIAILKIVNDFLL